MLLEKAAANKQCSGIGLAFRPSVALNWRHALAQQRKDAAAGLRNNPVSVLLYIDLLNIAILSSECLLSCLACGPGCFATALAGACSSKILKAVDK